MKKSTVIATCLLNSKMCQDIADGEHKVRQIFELEYEDSDFFGWDVEMETSVADHIISTVGRASRINVKTFIRDLWD